MSTLATTRRGFMQLSATSAALLSMGGALASLTGCSQTPPASGYKTLRPGDLELLTAVAPALLGPAYPGTLGDKAPERLMHSLDKLIGTLQDYSKGQLMLLLDVLQVAPIRLVMGAQWGDWRSASAEDIEVFLEGWKTSSIQLKRMGYGSLIKLYSMCWYRQPETYATSGYPGPPKHIIG